MSGATSGSALNRLTSPLLPGSNNGHGKVYVFKAGSQIDFSASMGSSAVSASPHGSLSASTKAAAAPVLAAPNGSLSGTLSASGLSANGTGTASTVSASPHGSLSASTKAAAAPVLAALNGPLSGTLSASGLSANGAGTPSTAAAAASNAAPKAVAPVPPKSSPTAAPNPHSSAAGQAALSAATALRAVKPTPLRPVSNPASNSNGASAATAASSSNNSNGASSSGSAFTAPQVPPSSGSSLPASARAAETAPQSLEQRLAHLREAAALPLQTLHSNIAMFKAIQGFQFLNTLFPKHCQNANDEVLNKILLPLASKPELQKLCIDALKMGPWFILSDPNLQNLNLLSFVDLNSRQIFINPNSPLGPLNTFVAQVSLWGLGWDRQTSF